MSTAAGLHDVKPASILVVDDDPVNRQLVSYVLSQEGHAVTPADGGPSALEVLRSIPVDLVILDIRMPDMNGHEVCRRIRADPATEALPVIMLTAEDSDEKLPSLDAGADDFVLKPFDRAELLARVRSLLRIKRYHDTISAQAGELTAQAQQLAQLNDTLEQRVAAQVAELQGLSRLRRFFSPQIAELVVASPDQSALAPHRRHIAVFFCDLRGFTAFSEVAEPEEVMSVLGDLHTVAGSVIRQYEATVGELAGDSVMAYFNDPLPCPEPEVRAVSMAVQWRRAIADPVARWRKQGHELGLGMAVASGYATLGMVGFEGRFEYTALGSVVNLAARLCARAAHDQILVNTRVSAAIEGRFEAEPVEPLTLKGVSRPVQAYNIV